MDLLIKNSLELIQSTLNEMAADPDRIFASSSFQTQSVPLLHLLSSHFPEVEVLFIDTGYLVAESLAFRDQLTRDLRLKVRTLRSEQSYAQQISPDGLPLYCSDTNRCCHLNKVLPLQNFLRPGDIWINGVRRDQTAHRAAMPPIRTDLSGVIRVHPMLDWRGKDIYRYIREHDLPRHPLENAGYMSIGCAPCTRRWTGGDARTARWQGSAKTECGLHLEPPSS